MRKFKFRLEAVLQFRVKEEENAKNHYLAEQQKRFEIEDAIRELEQVRRESLETSGGDIPSRLALQDWMMTLDDRRRQFEIALEVQREDEERARQEWVERRKEAKAMEKLKDSQYQEYQLDLARFEQAELDEWATLRRITA